MNKSEIYRNELLKISKTKKLTAENILDEAKKKKSPLHDFFDWDDSEAAGKWRLHQARLLINVVIEYNPDRDSNTVYSFEIIKTNGDKEYKHIDDILTNSDWQKQVVKRAITGLSYWNAKYQKYNFKELKGIKKEIIKLEEKHLKSKKKLKEIIAK